MRAPDGSLYRAALAKSSPVEVLNQPLFNPTGGYASYIVPAAFMLILQQTLLMGSATLGGVAFEQGGPARSPPPRRAPPPSWGRAWRIFLLALPGAVLFLVVLPRLYGFSATERSFGDLFALLMPFILSVSFLGQFVGSWFKRARDGGPALHRLEPAAVLPGRRLLAGRSDPALLRAASFIFPSTSAIDGLVRINQMGATLDDVFRDWTVLWALRRSMACLPSWRPGSSVRKELRWTRASRKRLLAAWPRSRSLLVAVSIVFLVPRHAAAPPLAGMVRQTEIRIAPEISGRLVSVAVRAGQAVRKGDLLAMLDNPELGRLARRGQGGGRQRTGRTGPASMPACVPRRSPSCAEACETAEANLLLAEQQNARAVALAARISPAASSSTRAPPRWPRRRPTSTSSAPSTPPRSAGPTAEERALADARVALAEATVADLQAKLDKTRLVAPVDGTSASWSPNWARSFRSASRCSRSRWAARPWFAFTLREDRLGAIDGRQRCHADDRRWPAHRRAGHGAPAARRIRDVARRARRRRP